MIRRARTSTHPTKLVITGITDQMVVSLHLFYPLIAFWTVGGLNHQCIWLKVPLITAHTWMSDLFTSKANLCCTDLTLELLLSQVFNMQYRFARLVWTNPCKRVVVHLSHLLNLIDIVKKLVLKVEQNLKLFFRSSHVAPILEAANSVYI